jgi:hypothetical protein
MSEGPNNHTHITIPNNHTPLPPKGELSEKLSPSGEVFPEHSTTPSKNKNQNQKYGREASEASETLEKLFVELWEKYPKKKYKGDARRAFVGLFPPELPEEAKERRIRAISERFPLLQEEAERLIAKSEAHFIPTLRKWLEKEGFADE